MSIKSLNQYFDNIRNNHLTKTGNDVPSDDFIEALEEVSKLPKIAQDIITEKLTEKELVSYMLLVQKFASSAIMTMNPLSPIILLEKNGELQAYTHTVIMSVVGALIQDEIL